MLFFLRPGATTLSFHSTSVPTENIAKKQGQPPTRLSVVGRARRISGYRSTGGLQTSAPTGHTGHGTNRTNTLARLCSTVTGPPISRPGLASHGSAGRPSRTGATRARGHEYVPRGRCPSQSHPVRGPPNSRDPKGSRRMSASSRRIKWTISALVPLNPWPALFDLSEQNAYGRRPTDFFLPAGPFRGPAEKASPRVHCVPYGKDASNPALSAQAYELCSATAGPRSKGSIIRYVGRPAVDCIASGACIRSSVSGLPKSDAATWGANAKSELH